MRFCYAHRRFTLYPQSVDTWDVHPDNYTPEFLDRAPAILASTPLSVALRYWTSWATPNRYPNSANAFDRMV